MLDADEDAFQTTLPGCEQVQVGRYLSQAACEGCL